MVLFGHPNPLKGVSYSAKGAKVGTKGEKGVKDGVKGVKPGDNLQMLFHVV